VNQVKILTQYKEIPVTMTKIYQSKQGEEYFAVGFDTGEVMLKLG
jgi:hypothetical protein